MRSSCPICDNGFYITKKHSKSCSYKLCLQHCVSLHNFTNAKQCADHYHTRSLSSNRSSTQPEALINHFCEHFSVLVELKPGMIIETSNDKDDEEEVPIFDNQATYTSTSTSSTGPAPPQRNQQREPLPSLSHDLDFLMAPPNQQVRDDPPSTTSSPPNDDFMSKYQIENYKFKRLRLSPRPLYLGVANQPWNFDKTIELYQFFRDASDIDAKKITCLLETLIQHRSSTSSEDSVDVTIRLQEFIYDMASSRISGDHNVRIQREKEIHKRHFGIPFSSHKSPPKTSKGTPYHPKPFHHYQQQPQPQQQQQLQAGSMVYSKILQQFIPKGSCFRCAQTGHSVSKCPKK
jgi:hypothetical protein